MRTGTLPLRTHYRTEIKVSTPPASGANRSRMAVGFSLKNTGFGPYINSAKSTQDAASGGISCKLTRCAEPDSAQRANHFNSIVSYAA
jgi:hypothetical protein